MTHNQYPTRIGLSRTLLGGKDNYEPVPSSYHTRTRKNLSTS